jgi:two-component system cell cycle sensor histidine kinase/response regulator CckA
VSEDRFEVDRRFREAAAAQADWSLECRIERPDGAVRWIWTTGGPQAGPDGRAGRYVGIVQDVTDRHREQAERQALDDQLRQAQKMESVGRLAGGVAHDFNNLLGVILGCSELLLRHASEAERRQLDNIVDAAERAAGLTRQLLVFSRRQIVEPKVFDLNAALVELQRMLGRVIGEDVELSIVSGDGLGLVRADPSQIEQVVMNLSLNARAAMPDGGVLRIETANAELDATDVAGTPGVGSGRYVTLTVTDNGCGIEPGILPKIFEPFFTTKEAGKGTGLGLATVYGIVKQAGGFISVRSEVGRGSSFTVHLPRVEGPVSPAEVREPPALAARPGTILVVEDEPALRAITRQVLAEHGYRVLEAASATEALEALRQHPEDGIDLLVTDVVLPGINGRQLAELLLADRPRLKVLYVSGYTDDAIAHRGILETGTQFLAKPYTAQALLRRVAGALQA